MAAPGELLKYILCTKMSGKLSVCSVFRSDDGFSQFSQLRSGSTWNTVPDHRWPRRDTVHVLSYIEVRITETLRHVLNVPFWILFGVK